MFGIEGLYLIIFSNFSVMAIFGYFLLNGSFHVRYLVSRKVEVVSFSRCLLKT